MQFSATKKSDSKENSDRLVTKSSSKKKKKTPRGKNLSSFHNDTPFKFDPDSATGVNY